MYTVISVMGKNGPDYFVEDTETGERKPITFDSQVNAQALADYLNKEKNDNSTHRHRNVRSIRK